MTRLKIKIKNLFKFKISFISNRIANLQQILGHTEIKLNFNNELNNSESVDLYDSLPDDFKRFAIVLREKDIYSYVHSQYVALYAVKLAKKLNLTQQTINEICIGAWIHDIGKILTPNKILRKQGSLNNNEYDIIKKHVQDGLGVVLNYDLSTTALNCLKYHHEQYDGKGYPFGLSGENTTIESKILQIADAFSAMTIKRVYRNVFSQEEALKELIKKKGTQFDPELVDVFLEIFK